LFRSLQTKIAVPVVGTLFLLVVFIVIYIYHQADTFARRLTDDRLQGAAQTAQAFLELLERYNESNSRAVAGKEYMIRLVNDWNNGDRDHVRDELVERIHLVNIEFGNDSFMYMEFTVTCMDGYVILRTAEPERYGDTGFVSPTIRAAHQGRNETVYAITPAMPMGLASSAPIWYGTEIIGSVSAIMVLSNMDFVDEFGSIFNAEITIFSGYTSLASTLRKEDGERAVGTIADQRVIAAVLDRGTAFDLELDLFGVLHHAFYFPLIGWDDVPIGMFFIGFSIEEALGGTANFIFNIIIICAVGMLFAAGFMFLGIHFNSKKVKHLAELMDRVADGGDYTEIFDAPISNDEIGSLTESLSSLAKIIGKLSDNKSVREIKEDLAKAHQDAEKAQMASKVKSDFLGRMSHEIRTPISAILGATEIQLRTAEDETRRAFEQIYSSGNMLLGIINDILDLSKIESGKLSLTNAKYEVASMLSDTVQLNAMNINSKPIQFEISVNESIPAELQGDELRIKQILNNVLSNAFKYTDKGKVTLSVGKVSYDTEQITFVFTIKDTGHGMTAQQVSTLFDEYTRFNHGANREVEGTGLGMTIAKMLVNMMDGHISVQSELNVGTTFTIKIPQTTVSDKTIGKKTADNISKFNYTSRKTNLQSEWENMSYGKVLIVDDINANIYVTKGLLAPYGLQIDSASSGSEAIKKIEGGAEYDIVFMDHMMPKMDGIETVQHLRNKSKYTRPIVAFTANALVGLEEEFLQNGFDGFVTKPIQSAYLDSILIKFVRDKYPEEVRNAANANALPMPKFPSYNKNQLYKDFVKSEENTIKKIIKAISKSDYKKATLLAHTLKSLSGLIDETNLASLAYKVEAAFQKSTYPYELMQKLDDELNAVLDEVRAKIRKEEPIKIDKKPKEIFITVETLLNERNGEVITMLPILSAIPGTEELVHHIENFNFEEALECLGKLSF